MSLWTSLETLTAAKLNQKELYIGSTAPTTPTEGQLWFDTTVNKLKVYDGLAWKDVKPQDIIEISNRSHADLQNLGWDSHTQYLHLNKAGQTLQQDLAVAAGKTIDGVDISKLVVAALRWHSANRPLYAGEVKFIEWEHWENSFISGEIIVPISCYATALRTYVRPGLNSLNGDLVITVQLMAVDTSMQITIPAGQDGAFVTTANPFSIQAGQRVAVKADASAATSGSVRVTNATVKLAMGDT